MESPKAPATPTLTLEEKAWFEQRTKDLQQYSSIGGATGAVISAAITFVGPFPRRYQIAAILGSSLIGSLSGYLWADTKSIERINDLSATSQLRKQLTKIHQTKKAAEAATAAAKTS